MAAPPNREGEKGAFGTVDTTQTTQHTTVNRTTLLSPRFLHGEGEKVRFRRRCKRRKWQRRGGKYDGRRQDGTETSAARTSSRSLVQPTGLSSFVPLVAQVFFLAGHPFLPQSMLLHLPCAPCAPYPSLSTSSVSPPCTIIHQSFNCAPSVSLSKSGVQVCSPLSAVCNLLSAICCLCACTVCS